MIASLWRAFVGWDSRRSRAVRSIRHQIVVVAQGVLNVERRASRCVGISSARGKHTQGPIILSALIRDVIYCDIQNAWTPRLLPDFC
jgi:hypothetical protein